MSYTLTWRVTAATVGLALAATGVAAAAATAAPSRSATTATDDTYLQDTLGLPANTVIDTVTYDRFQHLLQQPGQFAFVIGSANDPGFKAKSVAVDAAARAAGVTKVYWFDPNLTGQSGIKNLDTRNPSGINLAAASQNHFGNTWKHVIGRYLGNGIKSVQAVNNGVTSLNTVVITADDTIVNDSVNPLWDYRSTATAAVSTTDDVFFTYDKNHKVADVADTVVDWVNLSSTGVDEIAAGVNAALAAVGGGAAIDQVAEFTWWRDSNNAIQTQQNGGTEAGIARYGGDILTDADAENGWNVEQLTYPELLHLLDVKDSSDKNFVILFGGTWCPNTRAVIKFVNDEAVDNNVKVYNFDLVLDGGKVNGTNGGGNPIHVRDNANSGTTFNFRPSWVYGDVVRTYFKNLVTQYDPNTGGGNRVAYYPGGDLTAFPDVVRKLQVPFLIGYERGNASNPSSTAVKRQWIQQNTDQSTGLPTFKEYMSNWWFTNPSAQIGLNFAIPADESTLSEAQQTQLAQARANAAFGQEAVDKLGYFFKGLPGAVVSSQTVTAPTVAYGKASTVTVAIANTYGRVPNGTATLTVGGKSYSADVANNAAVFTTAKLKAGTYAYTLTYGDDDQIKGFTKSGTLTVGKAAVKSTSGVVKKAPTTKAKGTYTVTVAKPAGLANATGKVTVTLKKGSATKKVTGTLKSGKVTITVPKLAKGTWKATVSYTGDTNYKAAKATGKSIVVKK